MVIRAGLILDFFKDVTNVCEIRNLIKITAHCPIVFLLLN